MPYLMFLDESYPESHDYAQLSGFVIDIESYKNLRYDVLSRFLHDNRAKDPSAAFDCLELPHYKWSDFLPEVEDRKKMDILDFLFRAVYHYSERVFCYGIHGPIPCFNETKPNDLLSFCWSQLHYVINDLQAKDIIIPVVDLGLDNGFRYQYSIYARQNYTAVNSKIRLGESAISLNMPENLLEPFFATDEYSIGVQLADIVGGLRLFNSKKSLSISVFDTRRKAVLDPWYNHQNTMCRFETWVNDESGSHSNYHDSRLFGRE